MDKVLVTGATGFIALHCIYYLLKRGYAVHGTVRSLDRKQEVLDAMLKQGLSTDNLNLFEADLLDDKNWDEAVAGCKYVLHVASPVIAGIPKDENDLIQPAIQGTVRVLEASKNTGTVHKAVVVRTRKEIYRDDGSKVQFDTNAVVLTDEKGEPIGTRIFGPVTRELRTRGHTKIISLAPEVL